MPECADGVGSMQTSCTIGAGAWAVKTSLSMQQVSKTIHQTTGNRQVRLHINGQPNDMPQTSWCTHARCRRGRHRGRMP